MTALPRLRRATFSPLLGLTLVSALAACGTPVSATTSIQGPAPADGEVWVTLQATSRVDILHGKDGRGPMETITLPAGTGPHITTFSPEGDFAYVSGMGNGDLDIIRADTRQLIDILHLGRAGTHQAKSSPDGSVLLVAQIGARTLFKVAADLETGRWNVVGTLSFASLGAAPICSVYRDDGKHAYVSLLPSGLAVVDVSTMSVVRTFATDGFIACGMIKSKNGKTVTVAAGSGSGGHIYRLDTGTETLTDAGKLIAPDWHSFNMSPDEKLGFGTVPRGDQLVLIDLRGTTVSVAGIVPLDPTPGAANDQPDAIGVRGNTVFVSLRASGKIAVIEVKQREESGQAGNEHENLTVSYLDLASPSAFNPANCSGCAVHGVAVRP
jgi:DNA-binding beta-propeller fold protein YncE